MEVNKLNCLIDLHLHLDGALTLKTIKHLANKSNILLNESDKDLIKKIQVSPNCRDLTEFLEKFEFPLSFLQSKENIKEAVKCVLNEQQEQGLIYCEIRFAPQLHLNNGLTMNQVVESAIEGLKESKVKGGLILCLMRGADETLNKETIDVARKYLGNGVVAIDIAGAEALFPLNKYKNLFEYAKSLNIPFTIHAGEAGDYDEVETALDFGCSRIGHGIHAQNNNKTMDLLSNSNVVLEMCPTSNLQTKSIKDLSEYPLRKFLNKGIKVTINQDDPSIEGTTLKDEWKIVIDYFSLTKDEVKNILLTSAKYSFADEETKIFLKEQIEKNFENI